MPRTTEQLEPVRVASRELILTTALELFARHGYAATSVRMIAREAGISLGLLYNYYDGKEALLRAVFERTMADVQASFAESAGGATAAERLERLIRSAFAIVAEHLSFWRLTYQIRMQQGVLEGLDDELRKWTGAVRLQLEELLRGLDSSSPEVEARVLFAAIDGAAQHFAMDPDGYPVDDVAATLIARFLPHNPGGG
ncbi:MAG TPA: TetR/AcrR family transcriptional regulator [Longimicrobiales bacterium]